jgi:hypothetical protein
MRWVSQNWNNNLDIKNSNDVKYKKNDTNSVESANTIENPLHI